MRLIFHNEHCTFINCKNYNICVWKHEIKNNQQSCLTLFLNSYLPCRMHVQRHLNRLEEVPLSISFTKLFKRDLLYFIEHYILPLVTPCIQAKVNAFFCFAFKGTTVTPQSLDVSVAIRVTGHACLYRLSRKLLVGYIG